MAEPTSEGVHKEGRVLSGMRPSGKLHLGHYHGVIKNWLKLQKDFECFFFVADWHALTSEYGDTARIRDNSIEMVADWLACGLDPKVSTIFEQSKIIEHGELFVLLSMITPLPWLERNPTYKEQLAQIKDKDLRTYGFLGYPVLQTADIIIYKATGVPVGEDQAPHVELSREITRRFNHNFNCEIFPEPQTLLTEARKMLGVDGRKMSKSYNNSIYLSDTPKEMEKKVKTMATDPARVKRTDPGNPNICPLYETFHTLYSDEERLKWVHEGCTTAGIGCIECKMSVIPKILEEMTPIQERRAELVSNKSYLFDVLSEGEARARSVARDTMEEVRSAVGLK